MRNVDVVILGFAQLSKIIVLVISSSALVSGSPAGSVLRLAFAPCLVLVIIGSRSCRPWQWARAHSNTVRRQPDLTASPVVLELNLVVLTWRLRAWSPLDHH